MIVCLIGRSAAGKSTLAKELESRHPERFARVPVDFFFVPRPPGVTIEQYLAVPLRYDWDAVDRAIAARGPRRSTPDCDFDELTRRSDHGGLLIHRAPVLLLDGMRPHPRCDVLVLLELDPTTQRQRLLERDCRWGTDVAERMAHLERTFAAGWAERPRDPDLRLPATDPIEVNAERLADALVPRA